MYQIFVGDDISRFYLEAGFFLTECKTLISVCHGRRTGAGQVILHCRHAQDQFVSWPDGRDEWRFAVITSSGTRFVLGG